MESPEAEDSRLRMAELDDQLMDSAIDAALRAATMATGHASHKIPDIAAFAQAIALDRIARALGAVREVPMDGPVQSQARPAALDRELQHVWESARPNGSLSTALRAIYNLGLEHGGWR
jgi:hypothetical protein